MDDLQSKIDLNISYLRKALEHNETEEIDRANLSLEKILFSNDNYKKIGDERTLYLALQLMRAVYDSEIRDSLIPLSQWLEIVKDINDKFYSIVNHEIGLEELLLSKLNSWKILPRSLDFSFDEEIKQIFQEAREKSNTEQKIRSFITAYLEYLKIRNLGIDLSEMERSILLVVDNLPKLKTWKVFALFSLNGRGNVYGLKVQATANGKGAIDVLNTIGLDMANSARGAFTYVKNRYPATKNWDITWDVERADIPFDGNSIGLALILGILSSVEGFEIDPYTAFTGQIVWDTGDVKVIGDLELKLSAAKEAGFRRVFIPWENAKDVSYPQGLTIVPVRTVEEAKSKLLLKTYISSNDALEGQADLKLRQIEIELATQGIKKEDGTQKEENFKRAIFTDFQDRIIIDIYFGKNGIKPVIQQKNCSLYNIVQAVCDKVFGSKSDENANIQKRTKYIVNEQDIQLKVRDYLLSFPNSILETEANCIYRVKISKNRQFAHVRQFSSGTLTIDGSTNIFDEIEGGVRAILGITSSQQVASLKQIKLNEQIQAVKDVDLGNRWIGTDEAGKGDYFGPLVGAAILVDKDIADRLIKLGVKDSKVLSDKRNRELAEKIITVCGKRAQVVLVPPERYNSLYQEFKAEGKNLNTLLAWIHTRALEDILTVFPQDQITVIIDKFADEQYIKNKLLEKARQTNLNLVQLPKAEANIAVAAASILARAQFLNWLDRKSKELNLSLPKGSSDPRIKEVALQLIQSSGPEILKQIAKLHFKTTNEILD